MPFSPQGAVPDRQCPTVVAMTNNMSSLIRTGQQHYPDRQGGVSALPLSLQLPCGDLPAQSRHRSEVAQRLWLIGCKMCTGRRSVSLHSHVRLRAMSARQQLKMH